VEANATEVRYLSKLSLYRVAQRAHDTAGNMLIEI
jgi:hypothetical protein